MTNYEKVTTNFLTPMIDLYAKKLNDYQTTAYVEELGSFTQPELSGAVAEIRRKSKYFPTIADAIAACFKVRDHALARNNKASAVDGLPVYQKDKKAKEMVADYVKSYRSTPLFLEASREGWDLSLLRYVQAVASTQAQMIQTINVGWNKADVFGIDYAFTDETLHLWLQAQKEQASTGYINVAVPTGRIHEWKSEVKKVA